MSKKEEKKKFKKEFAWQVLRDAKVAHEEGDHAKALILTKLHTKLDRGW